MLGLSLMSKESSREETRTDCTGEPQWAIYTLSSIPKARKWWRNETAPGRFTSILAMSRIDSRVGCEIPPTTPPMTLPAKAPGGPATVRPVMAPPTAPETAPTATLSIELINGPINDDSRARPASLLFQHRTWVVVYSQFYLRSARLIRPWHLFWRSLATSIPTRSSIFHTLSVIPAATAGVVPSVICGRQKL